MRNHFLSRLVRLLFVVPILISGLSARADFVIAISNGSLGTYQAGRPIRAGACLSGATSSSHPGSVPRS